MEEKERKTTVTRVRENAKKLVDMYIVKGVCTWLRGNHILTEYAYS